MSRYRNPHNPELTAFRLAQRLFCGETALDLLDEVIAAADGGSIDESQLPVCLQVLVKHGARLATGEKGSAFEKLFCTAQSAHRLPSSDLIEDLMDIPGEIPLHIFARDRPGDLHEILPLNDASGRPRGVHKRDAQGRNVSHWLWGPDGSLAQRAAAAHAVRPGDLSSEADRALWIGTVRAAWIIQGLLQDLGVGMELPDAAGVTAMDLCLERITAEATFLIPDYEICHRVRAFQAGLDMATSTPPASARHLGTRL